MAVLRYIPAISRALEKDVAEARRHMNLSRRDRYSNEGRRDLPARIGAEGRGRQMPPSRYTLLHPESRLSDSDMQAIYNWTRTERRALRGVRE